MTRVWRICKRRHAASAFSGGGARLVGGRWNSPGRSIVYTSDSPALATLEILVHLQDDELLSAYVLIAADLADSLVERLDARSLPEDWSAFPAPAALREVGDGWADARRALALRVPSALVPGDNVLLNPRHPDFEKVRVSAPEPLRVDPRLAKRRAPG